MFTFKLRLHWSASASALIHCFVKEVHEVGAVSGADENQYKRTLADAYMHESI